MKITEVSAEVTRSYNYQSYKVGMTATVEEGDNDHTVKLSLINDCEKAAMAHIENVKLQLGGKQ